MNVKRYHIPVMLEQSVEGLAVKPDGVYVDLTFGGGGHAREVLKRLENGHLYGFDQDGSASANVPKSSNFTFVKANFRDLKAYLRLYKVSEVDGILADLGVSSRQIDEPNRGFSTRFDGELDMRMDTSAKLTAKEILNNYPEAELHKMFGVYGEVRNAKTLAQAVVSERINKAFETNVGFRDFLKKFAPRGREFKYFAQVFQALRIAVNDEMGALEDMLLQAEEVLVPGGRLVVISYHSLEDRMVKNFMATGKIYGEMEKDFYGNILRPLEPISRRAIKASEQEVASNNRARSARLRIAKKL